MPSPLGHAMAGVAVAWIAEIATRKSALSAVPLPAEAGDASVRQSGPAEPPPHEEPSFAARAVQSLTPLAVACGVVAIAPDFDIFFHTHRTYSHSLGAAAMVWILVAATAWMWRRVADTRTEQVRFLRLATVCGAAYASHVLLDWLGTDLGRHGGLMALWPLSDAYYRSGLNLFFEIVPPHRVGVVQAVVVNAPAIARELLVLGPVFLLVWLVRVEAFAGFAAQVPRRDEAA